MLDGLVAHAARRPRATLAVVALFSVIGAVLALSLRPSAGIDTLISRSSADYRASQVDYRQFGSDAVVVLVREPLSSLIQPADLATISRLEACLDGQRLTADSALEAFEPVAARRASPYGGAKSACGKLMRYRPAEVVYGPGTFLNRAVAAVNAQLRRLVQRTATQVRQAEARARSLAQARGLSPPEVDAAVQAAGRLEAAQQISTLEQAARATGITSPPSIADPEFIRQIIFGAGGRPKARFAYLFPTSTAAVIQVRLRAGLSDARQAQAIGWIRSAVATPQFRLRDGSYLVSGEPVVLGDLASEITGQIALLLIGAVVVMAVALLLVFRRRPRLLPLAIALATVAITFGLMSIVGASLTMASIAVLPVLIGLVVDYAIQFQSGTRLESIAVAALATGVGFLVLLLSPVPMVRGFAALLVVGVAIGFVCAASVVSALARVEKSTHVVDFSTRPILGGTVGPAIRGAAEILRDAARPLARLAAGLPATTARHPGRVLLAALVLALGGWFADTRTAVQSDVTKLVPANMPALRNLDTLEHVTGVSGEIDVLVHATDVATPRAIGWMSRYERRIVRHFGDGRQSGCATATVCPALSLPDLASSGGSIGALLRAVPSYFTRAVITPNRRYAALAFGIRLMPLSRQQRVIAYMRSQLRPPPGVTASLAGLPVLGADAGAALSSSSRRLVMLAVGLLAIGLMLLAVFRSAERALVPLVPIALATGWSALVVYALGIPLNPMSATLGALVIAISTEFSVLLSERVRQERGAGVSLQTALEQAYRSTGAAVLASGVTAIAGFGVLVLSDIRMLRDFGFVTLIDMSVSLAGVLLVLPAVVAAVERGAALHRRRARLTRGRARQVTG